MVMVGLGILFRIFRRFVGKSLEDTGALPTRYYLNEVLNSLDKDDIGQAVKLLKISGGARVDKSRWEVVRQQVLFRCRLLMERHHKRIHTIENRIKIIRNRGRIPWRWFQKEPTERLVEYENVLSLERRAQALLEQYEKDLKSI